MASDEIDAIFFALEQVDLANSIPGSQSSDVIVVTALDTKLEVCMSPFFSPTCGTFCYFTSHGFR